MPDRLRLATTGTQPTFEPGASYSELKTRKEETTPGMWTRISEGCKFSAHRARLLFKRKTKIQLDGRSQLGIVHFFSCDLNFPKNGRNIGAKTSGPKAMV